MVEWAISIRTYSYDKIHRWYNGCIPISYLHNESGNTQYSYHARRILIDDFSALRHGGAMVVRTFVRCVLGCKSTLYVGAIQKNYFAPARQLKYSLSQTMSFFIA